MAHQRSGFLLLLLLHEPIAGPQVQFELLHDPWVLLGPINELLQRDLTWNIGDSNQTGKKNKSSEVIVPKSNLCALTTLARGTSLWDVSRPVWLAGTLQSHVNLQ